MKLYELSQNYKNLLELVDNEDVPAEILQEALAEVKENINEKAENICKVIANIQADIEGMKAEEKRIAALRKSNENKVTSLKNYLENTLKDLNIKKIDCNMFKVSIAKNPPKLVLSDDFKPDDKYTSTQIIIDNKAIKDDLKAGVIIEGASLVQNESLRIK